MAETEVTQKAAQIIELDQLPAAEPAGPALLGSNLSSNLNLLQGVKVGLSVVVGGIETTLGELMALQAQSVLKVERELNAPVDLLLDGKLVARGQLVAVDDNFGVRITEIAANS